jgi:hypothetical protein
MEFNLVQFVNENLSTISNPISALVGAFIGALFLRRKNKIETSTQEFEKIKAGHMKEAVDMLLDSGKITYSEYYRMDNFLEIAKKADDEFAKNKQPTKIKQQSFDWFLRYYDSCNSISNEELQMIWAKILAEEIKYPGAYSLRTLECLKNLSPEEARIFEAVCKISFTRLDSCFLIEDKSFLLSNSISYQDLLKLEEGGLIKAEPLWLEIPFESEEKSLIAYNEAWVLLIKKDKTEKIQKQDWGLSVYKFTKTGIELRKAIYKDEDDFAELKKHLEQKHPKRIFLQGKINYKDEDRISYEIINGN